MLLDKIAGPQTSVAMTLLGEEVVGQKLVDLGLAWEALPDDQVDDRAMELARRCTDPELTRYATQTFRAQNASRQLPWQSALRAEQAEGVRNACADGEQAVQMWSLGRKA
jgi:enoyl-CoA hydratase